MKRTAVGAVSVLAALAIAAGGAWGAASKPFQAVVGHYKTTSAASKAISKLNTKGFSGFSTETDKGKSKYEVEKGYATQKAAKAEVAKLHKAGFKGAAVENEKSEKSTA
jgi:SPOR domain